jgi:hypothetical protein
MEMADTPTPTGKAPGGQRGVILLGLPRSQIRFLLAEADRLGTRPSAVAESIINKEMTHLDQSEDRAYSLLSLQLPILDRRR